MGLVKVKFNRNVGRKNKFSIMKLNEVKPSGDVKIENKISNRLIRLLFVVMGTIFVGLVYIAVLLPVVPQSPFLLIALVCYSRGSERLENWLINNRLFGKYLKDIRERGFFKEKVWKNKWFWGIVITKVLVLGIVLYSMFGINGVMITLLIGIGKLSLFLTSIYISERIWRVSISKSGQR